MKKSTNIIGYRAIILASIFLLTPNISLFDITPDFIAYLLLYNATGKISNVIPHFEDAKERFQKLLWISLSKIPAFFIMLTIASTHQSERSIIAVFSLVYAIVELIYIYPAFTSLFDGFFYLEARFTENESSQATKIPQKFTAIFFTVKMIACCLPEMSLISVSDRLGTVSALKLNIAKFYPMFSVLGAIITLVLGVMWYSKFSKYIKSLSKNHNIEHSVSHIYSEKHAEILGSYSHRYNCIVFSLLLIGVWLNLDLILDNRNCLPDIFSVIFMMLSVFMMRNRTRRVKLAMPFGIAYCLSDLIFTHFLSKFQNEYTYSDIERIASAEAAYTLVSVCAVIECVISICFFFAVAYTVSEYLRNTTGHKLSSPSNDKYNDSLHSSLTIRSYIGAGLGSLASVAYVVYIYLQAFTEKVQLRPEYSQSEIYMASFGWFWIVLLALAIIWIVYSHSLVSLIKQESERYNLI